MSTPTQDRQFLLMSILGGWIGLRIVAAMIGLAPWSAWVGVAFGVTVLAFGVWIGTLEDQ